MYKYIVLYDIIWLGPDIQVSLEYIIILSIIITQVLGVFVHNIMIKAVQTSAGTTSVKLCAIVPEVKPRVCRTMLLNLKLVAGPV